MEALVCISDPDTGDRYWIDVSTAEEEALIKELMQDPDYAFEEFPMPRQINIRAKGAGTKEVEYSLMASPKKTPIPAEVLKELAEKPSPEELIEKMKAKRGNSTGTTDKTMAADDYPKDAINTDDIPF